MRVVWSRRESVSRAVRLHTTQRRRVHQGNRVLNHLDGGRRRRVKNLFSSDKTDTIGRAGAERDTELRFQLKIAGEA